MRAVSTLFPLMVFSEYSEHIGIIIMLVLSIYLYSIAVLVLLNQGKSEVNTVMVIMAFLTIITCSAKKNIYVIGGSKRELGSAWTRSECTYQVNLTDSLSNIFGDFY